MDASDSINGPSALAQLAAITALLTVVQRDVAEVKANLREKVDRREHSALEHRVRMVEKDVRDLDRARYKFAGAVGVMSTAAAWAVEHFIFRRG